MTTVIAMFLLQGKRKQAFGMQTTPLLPKYMEVNCSRVHRWLTPLITLHTMIDYLTFVWHSRILHFISVNQFGCLVIFGWRYLNLSLVNVPRLLKRTTVNVPGARNRPNITVLHLTFASWVIEFIICDVERVDVERKCDFMHDWISFSCKWHIFFAINWS